jgi:hypothetical protein
MCTKCQARGLRITEQGSVSAMESVVASLRDRKDHDYLRKIALEMMTKLFVVADMADGTPDESACDAEFTVAVAALAYLFHDCRFHPDRLIAVTEHWRKTAPATLGFKE